MTSIDIINMALSQCGCAPISKLEDANSEERIAKANYVPARQFVVADREWTFAKRRVQLAEDPNQPAFRYTHAYIITSDVLRVVRCYDSRGSAGTDHDQIDDWQREGWRVVCNTAAPVYAEVLIDVTEEAFSPGMVQALAAYLASLFAIPLTENAGLAGAHYKRYGELLIDAAAMDGSQGRSQQLRPVRLPGRRQP